MHDYDDVLVTLLYEVATNYVNMRVAEKRIDYAKANTELQRKTVQVVRDRFVAGTATKLALVQAEALLYQTEATIYDLEVTQRISANQICVLLGIPPENLDARLGKGKIPLAPPEVAVGVPADLLRRRPDVRRAERLAAAQCRDRRRRSRILSAHLHQRGNSAEAAKFRNLFNPLAYQGFIQPAFQWNILNYGRIKNNVRLQDSLFQELLLSYQQTVLAAQQDVENGLVTFLKERQRFEAQDKSVKAAETGVKIVLDQFEAGTVTIARADSVRTKSGAAARYAGGRRGEHRARVDPGLQGPRRRLADSPGGLPEQRIAPGPAIPAPARAFAWRNEGIVRPSEMKWASRAA